jgi:hypothetical protein
MPAPDDPDEPTQFYREGGTGQGWDEVDDWAALGEATPPAPLDPGADTIVYEPARQTWTTPAAGVPLPPSGRRTNPWVLASLVVFVALIAAIVVLLLVNQRAATQASTIAPGPDISSTTVAPSTIPPSTLPATTLPVSSLPELPTTTQPSMPSTTVKAPAGNRAPTVNEKTEIQNDDQPGPNASIDLIRIANSDSRWAVDHISGTPGHEQDVQPGYHVLHQKNGTWQVVAAGTAQVDCTPAVPRNVVADFADILGSCPDSGANSGQ